MALANGAYKYLSLLLNVKFPNFYPEDMKVRNDGTES